MSYHAIGKEAWQELPNIFSDSELAATLKGGERFWAYTYTFPHRFLATVRIPIEPEEVKGEVRDSVELTVDTRYCSEEFLNRLDAEIIYHTCTMEAGISYSALTGLFTKYVHNAGNK